MKKFTIGICCILLELLADACGMAWADAPVLKETFPRLMGVNIGAKNYHDEKYQKDIAKLDIVILAFYPGWNNSDKRDPIGDVLKGIKRRNPAILIGQYTILNEAYDDSARHLAHKDKHRKLEKQNWWLRDAAGKKMQWTSRFDAWDVNITHWTRPDGQGKRYSEWLAERDNQIFFSRYSEFDIWFFDNVFDRSKVMKADWDQDGIDDSRDDERIAKAYRDGHVREWQAARRLNQRLIHMGNTDTDLSSAEYKGRLQGALIEGAIGTWWSPEKRYGWYKMMERYRSVLANTAVPHLVGFNVWGKVGNYRHFRYGITSCLLDDGYFSYTDEDNIYGSVPWFDEYDVSLGRAVDSPPVKPWQKGVYRRTFEKGMVLVNPTPWSVTVEIEQGYRRLAGKQDPRVNNGEPAAVVRLGGKDGIILVKDDMRD